MFGGRFTVEFSAGWWYISAGCGAFTLLVYGGLAAAYSEIEFYWLLFAVSLAVPMAEGALHEVGHGVMARLVGCPFYGITFEPQAATAHIDPTQWDRCRWKRYVIACAGPLMSAALATAIWVWAVRMFGFFNSSFALFAPSAVVILGLLSSFFERGGDLWWARYG